MGTISLDELVKDPSRAARLTASERRQVLIKIAAILAALATAPDDIEPGHDEVLELDEVSRRTKLSASTLRRNQDKFPFLFRVGRRVLASANGIDEWIARQRGAEPSGRGRASWA
jgi:predicted DNA-binding transcriptional regulator AlpA